MSTGVWLCALAGAACMGAAIRERTVVSRLRRNGTRTEGTVVRVLVDSAEGTQTPVIRFTDAGGHLIEFTPSASGIGLGLAAGTTVPVVYPLGNSHEARVFTARHRVLPSLLSAFVGAIFLGVAVVIALTD
ncbi:DUF3592 domain-containing protein [Streptomyces sp. Y7]|uniref:DUF3592 domain-containing protein n=1 Tax=Streptomyces sp. Y7 TaxID=3342392 RepID=UPI00372196D3